MALATITRKGQVTIPKSVRDSLMLSTGDKIEFVVTDKREALIRPISKKVDEDFRHECVGKISFRCFNRMFRKIIGLRQCTYIRQKGLQV